MKYKLTILTACLIALVFLTGCKEGGSSFGSFSADDDSFVAGVPGDSGSGGGSSSSSGSGDSGGDIAGVGHAPEPATLALLGSGLLTYALLRRKRRKQL